MIPASPRTDGDLHDKNIPISYGKKNFNFILARKQETEILVEEN